MPSDEEWKTLEKAKKCCKPGPPEKRVSWVCMNCGEEHDTKEDEFDLNDYINEDDIPSYKLSANNTSSDDERREIPFVSGLSFQDLLIDQLRLRRLSDHKYNIAINIIGNPIIAPISPT